MEGSTELPLFPLQTVLFVGGRLPLHIFEPRYVALVRRCLETNTGFGIVLIREGSEVATPEEDQPSEIFDVGTYATIKECQEVEGGRFVLMAEGVSKIHIDSTWEEDDRLRMAFVRFAREERREPVRDEDQDLVDALRYIFNNPSLRELGVEIDYNDARDVSMRLAEYLPLSLPVRQQMLELGNPRDRLIALRRHIEVARE